MNFLKKLTISLGILTFTLAINGLTFAATNDDFANVFDDEEPCIDIEGKDKSKLIQFIEEPFGTAQPPKDGYEIRDCARNTLQYIKSIADQTKEKATLETVYATLAKCSTNANNLAEREKNTEFKAKFNCQPIQAIISEGGTSFLFGYIGTIYRWSAGLVGIVAVTVIIFSGIQITVSGGEPDTVSKAKTRIIKSLSGIALLFLSALILNTVNPNFFTSTS